MAVCGRPAGRYEFYGIVQDRNGQWIGKRDGDTWQFDPGAFRDEDGSIYLYSENGPKTEQDIGKKPKNSCVMQLCDDMVTIREEPRHLLPILGEAEGSGFEGHEFFEASSVRKINGKYYLIYSSVRSRELCYAISDKPDRDYHYAGVLVDNSGEIAERGQNRMQIMWGNNHGSIEHIRDKWYVFYHRPTNKTQFSRQACAEELELLPDGRFRQAEMTSQGLNGGVIGYKYFRFDHLQKISIRTRGCAKGVICVRIQEKEACQIAIQPSEDWTISTAKAECRETTGILRMEYHGQGVFDLLEFSLE